MLNSLFKPAWKSASAEKRLGAIGALNSENSDHQQVLIELASDVDSSVSIAAIEKINSLTALLGLYNELNDNDVRSQADKRIAHLLSTDNNLSEQECMAVLKNQPQLGAQIAAHATYAGVRLEAIKRLPKDQLLDVLGVSVYTDVRQLIAEQLPDLDQLESARKLLQGKDKNAERILKARIDKIRLAQRIKAENLATVEKLIAEAEYLAEHDWLPEFKAKFLAHKQHWDSIDFDIDEKSKQQYQTSRSVMEKRYEEQRLIEETHQSRLQLLDEMDSYLKTLANKDTASCFQADAELPATLQQFDSKWQALAAQCEQDIDLNSNYRHMAETLQSALALITRAKEILQPQAESNDGKTDSDLTARIQRLNSALKKPSWSSEYGKFTLAEELQVQLEEWRQQKEALVEEKEQMLAQLHKKISSIFRLARAGHLGRAKQTLERAEKALAKYSGKEQAKLEERLEEARKTVGDMGDWKNFATEPKYIELCQAMEALADSKLNPDKLSKKIKELQQQWKALGHCDISDQYWPRFKETADRVYKPCAEFFEQRKQTRKAHLEQRQQYVDQMRELLESTNWENDPDYKSIQTEVRKTGDNFFAIKDVEHGPGQKQWKIFSKLKDQVYAKLDVAYQANIEIKKQLVKQATELAEAEASENNLAKLKTLQTRWKNVGITKRNADQKAWKEFKKQGDIVFNNIQAVRQGEREEVDQHLNAYRDIIKKIQKLANTASELSESDQQFSELQAQYDALPELPENLPEKLLKGIQRDYRKACDQFDNRHIRILNSIHNQQIDALRKKAELCSELESLGESPSDNDLEKISQQWDAIQLKDVQISKRIEARRAAAHQAVDKNKIGAERRMMCIKLEIATGNETPAEDKSLRMQYQLEQMNKSGLGQQAGNSKDELEQMEIDWLCMPGAEPELQKRLDKRFKDSLK